MQPSVDGHIGCLHVLALVNNAAMNIEVHLCFQISIFIFFKSGVDLLDHMVVLFL